MKRFFAILSATAFLMSSCHLGNDRVKGNGNLKTENRSTGSFSRIDVSGNIKVFVKQDSLTSVRVEADENLLPLIIVKTEGDRLVIEPEKHTNLDGTKDIRVYVSGPSFSEFEASGASSISSENMIASNEIEIDVNGASSATIELKSPKVSASAAGASFLSLKGQTKDLVIEGDGASEAKCYDLLSENASVDVSGASSAEIFASVRVKGDASGASHIRYKGAATHTGSASGAGSISKVD